MSRYIFGFTTVSDVSVIEEKLVPVDGRRR